MWNEWMAPGHTRQGGRGLQPELPALGACMGGVFDLLPGAINLTAAAKGYLHVKFTPI